MRMHHFWPQNGPFAPNFFWKILLISFSSTYWLLSLCKIFKKLSQQIQSYDDVPLLGPWPIWPNENFSRKSVNKHCSFHSHLSKCQKSKSYINLLIKHWQLKNTVISLTESHFGLYIENQIFPKHAVFTECEWTIRTFILHKFLTKLMTWFS